jgi:hypothetical protein
MPLYISQEKYLTNLIPDFHPGEKKGWRWILKENEVMYSTSKNQKIEKVLTQIHKDLKNFNSPSIDIEDKLEILKSILEEKVGKYKQRHSKIYLKISRWRWGDVDQLSENVIRQIVNLQSKINEKKKDTAQKSLIPINFQKEQKPVILPASIEEKELLSPERKPSLAPTKKSSQEENFNYNLQSIFYQLPRDVFVYIMQFLDFPSFLSLTRTTQLFFKIIHEGFVSCKLEELLKIEKSQALKDFRNPHFNKEFRLMLWLGPLLKKADLTRGNLNSSQLNAILRNCPAMTKINLAGQKNLSSSHLLLLPKGITHLNLSSTHHLSIGSIEKLKNYKIEVLKLKSCQNWFQDFDFARLPNTLKSLTVENNDYLYNISRLPPNIEKIVLKSCNNIRLNLKDWPESLTELDLSLNFPKNLSSQLFPKAWPRSLKKLTLQGWYYGYLHLFPQEWPQTLKWINLSFSSIPHMIIKKQLPPFPPSIEFISFQFLYPSQEEIIKIIEPCKNLKDMIIQLKYDTKDLIAIIDKRNQELSCRMKITICFNTDENAEKRCDQIKAMELQTIDLVFEGLERDPN